LGAERRSKQTSELENLKAAGNKSEDELKRQIREQKEANRWPKGEDAMLNQEISWPSAMRPSLPGRQFVPSVKWATGRRSWGVARSRLVFPT
jgi:hypothetical protein